MRSRSNFSPVAGSGVATSRTSSASSRHLVTPNHRSAHSQQLSTPGSARSSIGDLEETISNIMGVRMHSLSDLRARIEQLSELHRREEAAFRNQMGMVLEQSEVARMQQQRSVDDYEKLLAKERAERQRLVSMMAAFKHEGSLVMSTLKESLADVTRKYKQELDRSAKLAAQLRNNASSYNPPPVHAGSGSQAGVGQEDAVDALKSLLEEADAVIVELEQRNRHLESKVQQLQKQRDSYLDNESTHFQSDEFHHEFNQLLAQIRAQENSSTQTLQSVRAQLETMSRYARLLMNKLNVEQRQRLRAEEQAANFAAAQDQRVLKLEARLKELEGSDRGAARIASPRTDRTSPVAGQRRTQAQDPPPTVGAHPHVPMLRQPLARQESAASTATSSEGPVILSLEEQLNTVSSEFQQSVQQWQKALRTDEVKPQLVSPADEEFLPDSPRSI